MKINCKYIKNRKLLLILSLLSIFFSCEKERDNLIVKDNSKSILSIPEGFPPIVFPADNSFSEARWKLGKRLFYDKILSIDQSLSCASCHQADFAFADNKNLSPGVFGRAASRNAPSLANVAYHPYFLREGSVPTLEMQVLVPIQEHNEFNHNIVEIAKLLNKDSSYVKMSWEAYNQSANAFVITRALANFQRTLISGNSRYDQYVFQAKSNALTLEEKNGMQLFMSDRLNCNSCHSGFNFTNYSFQNNGLDTVYDDNGRFRFTSDSADMALFKVPSLRNIELTAPYMHKGQINTLEEVIEHYNSGGKNHPNKSSEIQALNLSQKEKNELLAFLKSLTDNDFVNNSLFRK